MQAYRSEELYHHGIKGQRWGVRRYQNSDGSLTNAGRKRYTRIANATWTKQQKLQGDRYQKWLTSGLNPRYTNMGKKEEKLYNKYKELEDMLDKDKKIREANQNKKEPATVNTPKAKPQQPATNNPTPAKKSVKDMSDEELNAVVNRLNLEQKYSQLNPAKVSRGKKIADAIIAKGSQEMLNRASRVAGDMMEKKLRELAKVPNQQKK